MAAINKFKRINREKSYRKQVIIITEGEKTERQYFKKINFNNFIIRYPPFTHSSPQYLLNKVKEYTENYNLSRADTVWIVIDRDEWNKEAIDKLQSASDKEGCQLVLSNPKFEYWLVLHFESIGCALSSKECDKRLKKYIVNYNKSIEHLNITVDMVRQAINCAKQRASSRSCRSGWPKEEGQTDVYKLAEFLLNADN